VQRQLDAKYGAAGFPAFYVDTTAQLLHILPGFVRTYPHSCRLCRFERLEQTVAHELLAHAATRIDDFDHRKAILPQKPDHHPPFGRWRFDGVLDEVTDYALEAHAVRHHGYRTILSGKARRWLVRRARSDHLAQQILERDRHGRLQGITAAQLKKQPT